MKAYPISSNLKDLIVIEMDRIYEDSRRLWSPWSPIEGADYLGLSSDEFYTVLELLGTLLSDYAKRNLHNPLYLESLQSCICEIQEMLAIHKENEETRALKDRYMQVDQDRWDDDTHDLY